MQGPGKCGSRPDMTMVTMSSLACRRPLLQTSSRTCALPIPNIAGSRKEYGSLFPCQYAAPFEISWLTRNMHAATPRTKPLKYSTFRNVFERDCLLFLRASQAESRASGQLVLLKAKRKASKPEKAFREFDIDRQGEVRK